MWKISNAIQSPWTISAACGAAGFTRCGGMRIFFNSLISLEKKQKKIMIIIVNGRRCCAHDGYSQNPYGCGGGGSLELTTDCRRRPGRGTVVIGIRPNPTRGLLRVFFFIFSFSSNANSRATFLRAFLAARSHRPLLRHRRNVVYSSRAILGRRLVVVNAAGFVCNDAK